MASDYGLNFGFRRSDESLRVSEGRFRTPKTGTALLLGTVVTIDPASKGYLKAAASNAKHVPGITGLLVQEEIHIRSIYETDTVDSFGLGVARKNKLSVITGGAGVKFWLKNTAGQTRADGRAIPAVTIVDLTGVAVGDSLAWDGTKFLKVNGTQTAAFATVTDVDATKGYVEAVLV